MNAASRLICAAIRLYRHLVSPWLGVSCRFVPSCSHYAQEAIVRHGCFKGLLLACRRLLRCHPFGSSGYDPVPPLHPSPSKEGLA